MTSFKPVRTTDFDETSESPNPFITEPILASFPNNLPKSQVLSKMNFNIYQLDKTTSKKKTVRRVIKAEHKGIKYEAKSYSAEMGEKDQASDYYVCIFDPNDNRAYTVPVKAAYQFSQTIQTF